MIRNLKALGIVMAAAFAFSAMTAASASAQTAGHITATSPTFTLLGKEDPKGVNKFTAFESSVECPETVYTGHKSETTPHTVINSGDTAVTITPHYLGCKSGGEGRTVDMNQCDYTFDDFTTTGVNTYDFTIDLVCNGTNGVLITEGPCTVRIPPQTGLTGLHATNEAGGVIRIAGTVKNITAVACGGILHTGAAELHQNITATGAAEVEVSISD